MNKKEHRIFFSIFFLAITLFLYPLLFMRGSFLRGDNAVQFYPWINAYADAIRHFHFPFWTKSMAAGFPLMAEGQIGGFYPFNMLFFFLLPFKYAYNYSIIFHFVIAGVSTYFFMRKIGAEAWGATLSALIFCFGSTYAGCFYNIITLRTLAWFPAVLWCIESFFKQHKSRFIVLAGLVAGCQLLAGFIQMAFYSIIFYSIYFLYKGKLMSPPRRWRSVIKHMVFFVLLFSFIGSVQVLSSFPLAAVSSRDGATLGFAVWKSFSPAGLLGLIFPFAALVFGTSLYIGVISIFMGVLALLHTRRHISLRPIVLLLALSFMCALGRFNPLYVLALKATHLYSFRNPSKFLFFSGFALSALAGYGFSLFARGLDSSIAQRAVKLFRRILVGAGGLFLAAGGILLLFRDHLKDIGQWYVTRFVFGRPHHRHELSYYTGGVERLLVQLTQSFSLSSPYTIASWIFLAIGLFFVGALLRRKMKAAFFLLIVLDLFIFSFYGTGFRGNIAPFSYLAPSHQKLYGYIKSDTGQFRILPFGIAGGKLPNWIMPNAQMSYGLESVGLYTPLAPKRYHDALSSFEVVDNSLGVLEPREEAFRTHQGTLQLLNVKYVLSDRALPIDDLEYIMQEEGIYLYRYKDFFGRVFFTNSLQAPFVPAAAVITIDRESDDIVAFSVSAESDGFVVFSQMPYPGWRAFINRHEVVPIDVSGVAQAVAIPKGTSIVTFAFRWHDSLGKS